MGRRRIKTDPGLRAALDKELNGNTLSYIDNGYDEDEYEKTRKAYDLAMRIAAADDAFSSDAEKTDNMVKSYSGAFTGKQDPMHTMFANRMGELASTGVKGAADQAYNRIIKDAGEMADNGDIRKEDAEKIIRKAEYNRYYRDRYPDQVKKAGEQQAEFFKNLGISNKEYPWHVKYGNMSSDELKAASEAADMDNEEMEWLKNRYNAVRNSEYAKKYAGKSYSQINDIISKGKNIINTSDGKKEGTDAIENEYEKFMDWGPKSAITWDDVTNGKAPVKFGNVDMDRRPVIRWDENTKKKYAKELASWKDEDEKGYDPEPGKVDTVYGGSSRFGENLDGTGWEIAYTPILSDGTFMGKDRLYDYINKLVEKAYLTKKDFTEEDLLKLDNLHVIAGVDKSTDYDNDGNSADVAGRAMHFVGKYGAVNLAGTANAKKKDSSYTYGNDDLNDEEIEWLKGYAESIKKPEDYDTEIYEKWKTLKDLEDRYGYDEATGRFKDDGSGMNVREHVNRNNMLNEIISARENLDRIRNQKNKRAGDLKKEEYYNSLKDNTDYGIYAGRNLPASYYAADIDVDQMTPYEGAGLDSRYDMEGKEENTPVVAGNELVMSDEEKKNYNYLYHTQGEKAAKDYLSFIQEDLNRRRAEITAGNVNGYGTAMLYSLGTGWNRGLPDAMSKLSNLFSGDEAIPVTEDEYVNSILSEKYKDAGPKLFGRSIGQMGLETTENIGNMLPSMIASAAIGGGAGPVVGAAMMGISAGSNTANEAWRDGNDRSRSIAYGLVNGMLEGGLQYALGGIASFGGSVSGITKNALKSKMSGSLGKALMNLGVSGLSEGTEEYLQEVLDPIVRNQLLGEKNEMKFMTDDALYSGFQGALTSWILGGAGDISTAVNETRLTKLGKELRSSEDAYIDAARQYGLTDSIEEYEASKKTDLDYGKLVRDVKTAAAEDINEQFVSGIGRDHAEQIGSVIEAAEDMNLNNLIKDYNESDKTDHDTGELVLGVQAAIGNDILNAKSMDKANKTYAKMTEGAPEYVAEVADKALGDRLSAEIMSAETIEKAQKLYESNITEDTSDVIRQAADNAIAEREMEDAREKANKAFGVDKMSENTQNVKREMAKSTNTDPDQFSDGFNYYYAYGRSGESYERAVNADENTGAGAWALTESEKRLAWEQGRQDLESAYENKAPGSRVEGIVRKMAADEFSNKQRANGMREVRDGEVSKDIQTAIRGLSVINGVNTVLYASDEVADGSGRNIGKTAPNGWYDRNTNTIYLDVTADNAGKNAVMMVYAHEFTHSLQENAPKEYKALRDYIVKTFENSGKTLDGLIEDQLELANLNGVELTREKAVNEVIADACQELFKNSKAIEDLAQNNPTVFNKLRDFIKKAIASIRKVLKDSETTSEEAEMLRSILGDLTEAQGLYDDAVKAAATRETVQREIGISGHTGESLNSLRKTKYEKYLDQDLIDFYTKIEKGDMEGNWNKYIISDKLSERLVKDIKNTLGIDIGRESTTIFDYSGAKHIVDRHGKNGQADLSMADNDEIGILNYILKNYDHIEKGWKKDRHHKNSDNTYADTIMIRCKINDDYYFVNISVPDINKKGKNIYVLSEYKNKKGTSQVGNASKPHPDVQNELPSVPNFNINQNSENVNSSGDNSQHSLRQPPTTDTNGRKLSKGQSSYFKDSAVRDESGNLIVMYHGTPYGGFTVFRNGLTYFTPNKEYADRYHNPSASSVRGRYDSATNEQTYEVYLNITKPFDIRNAEDRKIFIDEYVKGGYAAGINPYLNRSEIEKQIADGIDWMEADNLYEFIMDNEYDYDGLVLNEGADGGYGAEVIQRGLSYVTFSPEQAKDVTNLNPTENEDINFSLRKPGDNNKVFITETNGVEYGMSEAERYKVLKDVVLELPVVNRTLFDDNLRELKKKGYQDILGKPVNAKSKEIRDVLLGQFGVKRGYKVNDITFYYSNRTYKESLSKIVWNDTTNMEIARLLFMTEETIANAVPLSIHDNVYKGTVREDDNLKATYVLLGAYMDEGTIYPVKILAMERENPDKNNIYMEIGLEKIETSDEILTDLSEPSHDTGSPASAYGTNKTKENSNEVPEISLPDLIKHVNDGELLKYIPLKFLNEDQILSAELYKYFSKAKIAYMKEYNKRPSSDRVVWDYAKSHPDIDEQLPYSLRNPNSPRKILADALDSAAQTDEEKKLLKEYKSDVTQLETLEYLVGEMEKAAGAAQTAGERDGYLQKAEIYRKCVQNADKKLLQLEATKPLKNVMEREAEARKKEGAEGIMKRYATRDERRRMREIRDRSKTEIAALTRMITKPTKKDYVPDVLKKTVGDFIQSIDFVSKYADPNSWNTEQWRGKMERLSKVLGGYKEDGTKVDKSKGETAVGVDPTMFAPDLLEQIDTFVENNRGKNISDLDPAALTDLYIITRKLRMGIRNYNRMYTNKRFESVERAGYETIEMLDEKKTRSRKRDIGIIRILDKLFNVDMMEPKSYFKRFGKAGESIYESIAEGDDRNKTVLQDASDYVAGVYKKLGIDEKTVRKWNSKKSKQSFDVRGNNITMTPLQIMTLYELSKRDQAMRHINRGGIRIEGEDVISVNDKDPSGKQENRGEKAVSLFDDEVKMITDTLTDEQKALADELQKWMANEGAAYGNDVSMKMYGSKNFTEPNYFPIKTDSNSRNASTNEDAGNANLYRILNLGMTKTVDETARNAVIIRDIMSAFSEHVADMASYYGYAMPIADAMKWFNYRYEIGHETKSVRNEMDRVFGKATQQYFKTLLADINGNTALNNDNVFDKMIGAYKAAAVGGNVRVVIQQPLAYLRALNVMNPKYLSKGLVSKNNIEEMEKYAPIAWWKNSSFRENGMGKSLKSTLTNDITKREWMTDFLTKPAGWADKVTWGKLWNAVKYEVKDQYGNMEYEDFMKKTARRFRQVVDETQVVDTKLSRSQLMRNQNGLTKLATAFMMEPTKTYNMLYDAYTSKNGKKIARATAVWALENIVLVAIKSAYDSFRRLNWSDDEKEKDYLQRFLDSAKTNATDDFNPFNMIPFIKELPGAFETILSDNDNNRAQRFDMQWLYDTADATKKVIKFYNGDNNEKDGVKALESVLKTLSNVSGVPVSNIWREGKTIANSVLYQFMNRDTVPEQIRRAAQYKYDGEFDKYKAERKKILEERYVSGEKKITSDEFIKMVDSEFTKIKKAAEGDTKDKDEFEQDKAMYKIGDAKKAVSDGNYQYVQEILDEIYSSGHPVTEEQKADYFDSKSKSFKNSLSKLLYKDPEDKNSDGVISKEEKADKVLAADYEKKKEEYLKLKIDGRPLFDEDYFLKIEKKDRKNNFDAALEAAGESADTGASAQNIQSIINEMYDSEKPDNKKAEVDYKKKKKSSIKSSLTAYYKSQPADVRAKLKVIYKKLYISGSKIKLYDNKSFVTMEKAIKAKEKEAKKTG